MENIAYVEDRPSDVDTKQNLHGYNVEMEEGMKKTIFLLFTILGLALLSSCGTLFLQSSDQNEYFLELAYCDSDDIFNINKNSGIFIVCATGESTQDKLFEISLKKELQSRGFNNIVLASSCKDFSLSETDYASYALVCGCEFMIAYQFEKAALFESGGGLASSSSILYLFDLRETVLNKNLTIIPYYFVVFAKNHIQSYEASLVSYNSFIAKKIVDDIKMHLSAEPESKDSQAFFEYGQKGVIEDYFKEYK